MIYVIGKVRIRGLQMHYADECPHEGVRVGGGVGLGLGLDRR